MIFYIFFSHAFHIFPICLFNLTFFGEFSLTSFAYFDILNLRLTERNYSAKSSEGKKNKNKKEERKRQ